MFRYLPFILILVLFSLIWQYKRPINYVSPLSDTNIRHQLIDVLNHQQVIFSNLDIDLINNKIIFNLQDNQQLSTIVLSTQKNLSKQITVLQKILKTVRINHQHLVFLNISTKTNYATIKSN